MSACAIKIRKFPGTADSKLILEHTGITEDVEIEVDKNQIIAFKGMRQLGDDKTHH
jgi:hypothetical protein